MSKHLLDASAINTMDETTNVHQFDNNAIRHARNLTAGTGMQRIGVHQVRLETGHASTTHHYHEADEEFIFIISGQGVARIGDEEFPVAAGDFMGFPAPSPAHSLFNPHPEDLVYLMGGERNWPDVVHYPDLQRSMMKTQGKRTWAQWDDIHTVPR